MSRPGPPPVPGGRSSEERERARREREARRAGHRREKRTDGGWPEGLSVAALEDRLRRMRPSGGRRPGSVPHWQTIAAVAVGLLVIVVAAIAVAGGGDEEAPAPPPEPETSSVTIPEGRSRSETAPLLKEAGVPGNYVEATERAPRGFNLRRYGAPRGADLEGFLFPATYELVEGDDVKQLVQQQLDAFEEQFGSVSMRAARSKNLTPYDVLIIASLIEREVAIPRERRVVASVIYNRLSAGMALGIDATTRYETDNWTKPLENSVLQADTPYNTRTNVGLPPGPIGNPGLASIEAAARPANTDYLYYVAKACGEGAHEFAETDAEFQRFADEYEQKRQELGRAPTEC